MKILLRIVALVCVLIGGFLIYAVIRALGSDGGARPAVAVLYVVISIVLGFLAVWLWRRPARATPA
jgi:predicted Co/Zn/Cd cation transporter (cation efflux family)